MKLKKKIKKASRNEYLDQRIETLRGLAQIVADNFQESMSILEIEIQEVLDEMTEEMRDECGYHTVDDVTQSITIRPSWEY